MRCVAFCFVHWTECYSAFIAKKLQIYLHISEIFRTFAAAKVSNTRTMENKGKIVEQIKHLGKELLPQGSHLLLYGSRARGDNRADSDWDLLVLLNRPQKQDADFAAISYPLMELGFSLGQYFSVHTYSQQECLFFLRCFRCRRRFRS